jgi:hypothetical protein
MGDKCASGESRDSSGVKRLDPRIAAELLLDARNSEEARLLMAHLREQGFSPDYVRSKSYMADGPKRSVVSILPYGGPDMTSVASLSVQQDLDEERGELAASATIVRLHGATTPIDFTILQVREGEVESRGPIAFRSLQEQGVVAVLKGAVGKAGMPSEESLTLVTRGRGVAPIALAHLVEDEVRLGFITSEERARIVADADLYSDVARLHSYVSLGARGAAVSCKYCTSTSCYACTSCSCGIVNKVSAIA